MRKTDTIVWYSLGRLWPGGILTSVGWSVKNGERGAERVLVDAYFCSPGKLILPVGSYFRFGIQFLGKNIRAKSICVLAVCICVGVLEQRHAAGGG